MAVVTKVVNDIKVEIVAQGHRFFVIAFDVNTNRIINSRKFTQIDNALRFADRAFAGEFSKPKVLSIQNAGNTTILEELTKTHGWEK